jgi:uncharacterized flavoprotein (TIGR03862 family)
LSTNNKQVVIVGGGPAGLIAAAQLKDSGCTVTIIDQKPTVGRKFLVAGEGGFNLTHSEPVLDFIEKYDNDWIKKCVRTYPSKQFRKYLKQIGVPTIVGSSGKVFPEETMKPAQVLSAIKADIAAHVTYDLGATVVDFNAASVTIEKENGRSTLNFDYLIFALGGASWQKTGSDGHWVPLFQQKGIEVMPLLPSNSGVVLYDNWLADLTDGMLLKNVITSVDKASCAGDILVTNYGLEGKPIYAVNRALRAMEKPTLTIDLKPQMTFEKIQQILKKAKNPTQGLKELKLSEVSLVWLRKFVSKENYNSAEQLAKQIKAFKIGIQSFRPIDEVISSAGGVATTELTPSGQLVKMDNIYCCGEMVDWDAPTGGYLIQACVSSGYVAGQAIRSLLIDAG